MQTLSLRATFFLALAALAAGCGLIAGVKDRTLVEGSGGSTSSASTSTTATTSTSGSVGGQGGTITTTSSTTGAGGGAGGSGGGPCPEQSLGVETIVCHQKRPTNLVVEGSSLYWANEEDGTIVTVPTSTSVNSVPSIIVTGQTGICGLVVAKGYVYWRTHGGGVLRRLVSGDGLVQPISEFQGDSCAISASDTRVYWANAVNPSNDVISSASFANVADTLDVVQTAEQVSRLDASHPPNLYWTGPEKGKLYRWNAAVGLSALPTGGAPCDVRTDGANLFWTDSPINVVGTSSLDFTEPKTITTTTTKPCSMALRAPYIYWAEELASGRIVRAQTGASAVVEVVADKQKLPCSVAVAVDGMRVFWTTCDGGEVLRLSVQPVPN